MAEAAAAPGVVIAASSGGVDALRRLLGGLDADFGASVSIVLHTASESMAGLCELLGRWAMLPVSEAISREPIRPGRIYLAPAGYHLLVERDDSFSLSVDDKVCFVRPSADVLFESAADAWRARAIGVVLTGANDDGARGLAELRRRGGRAIVQDPADAEFPAMPEAALKRAGADHRLVLDSIAPTLNQLVRRLASVRNSDSN